MDVANSDIGSKYNRCNRCNRSHLDALLKAWMQ
jgi:hypothetical protein